MSTYQEYQEACSELTGDTMRGDVDRRAKQAAAYVWGWQDGRGYPADTEEANSFAWAYGIHAAEYELGKTSYCRSIPDAFKAFLGAEKV